MVQIAKPQIDKIETSLPGDHLLITFALDATALSGIITEALMAMETRGWIKWAFSVPTMDGNFDITDDLVDQLAESLIIYHAIAIKHDDEITIIHPSEWPTRIAKVIRTEPEAWGALQSDNEILENVIRFTQFLFWDEIKYF